MKLFKSAFDTLALILGFTSISTLAETSAEKTEDTVVIEDQPTANGDGVPECTDDF